MNPQYMVALTKANEVRKAKANLLRDLKAGRRSLEDALLCEMVANVDVMDVLLALPRVGRAKAAKAFSRTGIRGRRTCGELTERQRRVLIETLDG